MLAHVDKLALKINDFKNRIFKGQTGELIHLMILYTERINHSVIPFA